MNRKGLYSAARANNAWFEHGLHRKPQSNTCYINSLIVGLRSMEPFTRTLLSPGFEQYFQVYGSDLDLVKAMHVLFKCMLAQKENRSAKTDHGKETLLSSLFECVAQVDLANKPVELDRQGDPMEVLIYMVEWLNQSLETVASDLVVGARESVENLVRLLDQVTITMSDLARCKCGHKTGSGNESTKKFVSLPIHANMKDIQSALDFYFTPEDVEMKCSGCRQQVTLKKSTRIEMLPEDIFIVSLNLFTAQGRTKWIPTVNEIVDLGKYYNPVNVVYSQRSAADGEWTYELVAVVLHQGANAYAGHYTCLAKNHSSKMWQWFDDERVEYMGGSVQLFPFGFDHVKRNGFLPYMLFYQRIKNQVEREMSREFSGMSIEDQQESIDWEADFDKENDLLSESGKSSVTKETEYSEELEDEESSHVKVPRTILDVSIASSVTPRRKRQKQSAEMRKKLDSERRKAKRQDPAVREKERILAMERKKSLSPDVLERQRKYIKEKRKDDSYRHQEQGRNTQQHRERRRDDDYRQQEQGRNTEEHRERRKDESFRQQEQARDTARRQNKRQIDDQFRQREREQDRKRRAEARNSQKGILQQYTNGIKEGPDYVCVCCAGMFFRRSVQEFHKDLYKEAFYADNNMQVYYSLVQMEIETDGQLYICFTCQEWALLRETKPTLSLANNLRFPNVDKAILDLNDTEERLCSPRIAFIQIRPLKWDRQKGLRGNVVNVPIDVMETIAKLPRNFNETETIQVNIKRRLEYNNPYVADKVNRAKVAKALRILKDSEVFKELNIKLDAQYLANATGEIEFIIDPQDRDDDPINKKQDDDDLYEGLYANDDENLNNPQIHQTMLLQDQERTIGELTIAPGENQTPMSFLNDQYAEEATFLRIFGGKMMIRNIDPSVTLQARCKSFFRNYDRRCATNVPYIFYMYRKLLARKLISAINISLKKCAVRTQITVKDILENPKLLDKFDDHDYKKFLKGIRSAPEFWNDKKRQLFAMIKQLGCPTFFLTLSPAEIDWPELIILLCKYLRGQDVTLDDVAKMTRDEKIDLVSQDPVTTARYFENRIRHLILYMFNPKSGPFRHDPVVDYFWRIEFQARGSPHVHMLIWMKDRPTYVVGMNSDSQGYKAIVNLIEKYITCESPASTKKMTDEIQKGSEFEDEKAEYEELERVIKFQYHEHKPNCLVDSCAGRVNAYNFEGERDVDETAPPMNVSEGKICKYGYPWPILDCTMILDPLIDTKGAFRFPHKDIVEAMMLLEKAKADFLKIKIELDLMAKEQSKVRKAGKRRDGVVKQVGLSEFLTKLKMDEEDYIMALRASINTPTVFHKRTSDEIMINPYNKCTLLRHKANMDIQFVLNSYGVACYLTSYLMKSHGVMNQVLRCAEVQLKVDKSLVLREKLVRVAEKFQNCSEISAQECVYNLLSMPMSYCSREQIFIITFKKNQRHTMLKPIKYLKEMSKDSTNVFMTSMQEKYAARPLELRDVCLAEFAARYNYISVAAMERRKSKKKFLIQEDEDELDNDDFEGLNADIELDDLDEDNDVQRSTDVNNNNNTIFKLRGNLGYLELREKLKIIRYRGFSVDKEPDEYYREQVMLFMPWKEEDKEVEVQDPFEVFKNNCLVIAKNRSMFENLVRNESEADAILRIEEEIENQEDLNYAQEAANRLRIDNVLMGRATTVTDEGTNDELLDQLEEEKERLREKYEEEAGFHAELDDDESKTTKAAPLQTNQKDAKAKRQMENDEYKRFMCRLNRKQHTYMINCLSKIKRGQVFYDLVVGESGTGKSNLIKAVDQCVNRYLRGRDNTEPEKERVVLCSYTGKASFNIGGVTLHNAFSLPVRGNDMQQLSATTVEEIRKKYRKLKLVIIDEISMVGANLFASIDSRLRQIYDKEQPFGGISLVLFGDFNQLHPVLDSWIFNEGISAKNAYRQLVAGTGSQVSSLWSLFRLFRLTEIMRQAGDKQFAEALSTLGNYGLCGLSNAQVEMFDRRIVELKDIPDTAIFLYHTNEKKNGMCEMQLNKKPGELLRNYAKHVPKAKGVKEMEAAEKYIRNHAMNLGPEKCSQLANVVNLKCGIKYMIFTNMDVADGLVNGTTGTLKKYDKYKDTVDGRVRAQVLWFDFGSDTDVGASMRSKHAQLYENKRIAKDPVPANWTPFLPSTTNIKVRSNAKWSIERVQFAVDVAEAITIDKAQGQTYDKVAFDLNQTDKRGNSTLTRAHMYVALSRVRKLEDLYLFGASSIIAGKQHQFMDEKARRKVAIEKAKKEATYVEMKRMEREASFVNAFPFTDESYLSAPNRPLLSVCVHNVANLRAHLPCVRADYGMMNADVLVLLETAVKTCEQSIKEKPNAQGYRDNYYKQYHIDNYILAQMGSSRENGAKNGCALYVSKPMSMPVDEFSIIKDNSDKGDGVYKKSTDLCEIGGINFKVGKRTVDVIYLYNHPDRTFKKFYKDLKEYMCTCGLDLKSNNGKNDIYVIGDMNLDLIKVLNKDNKDDYVYFDKMKEKLGLQLVYPQNSRYFKSCVSTDRDTCIDWCLTNVKNKKLHHLTMYESWFSDHKPLWLELFN